MEPAHVRAVKQIHTYLDELRQVRAEFEKAWTNPMEIDDISYLSGEPKLTGNPHVIADKPYEEQIRPLKI